MNWPQVTGLQAAPRARLDELPRLSRWNRHGFYAGGGAGLTTSFSDEEVRVLALPAWLAVLVFVVPALLRVPAPFPTTGGEAGTSALGAATTSAQRCGGAPRVRYDCLILTAAHLPRWEK